MHLFHKTETLGQYSMLLTNQKGHSFIYIIALFFIQSYSVPNYNKPFNSARLPALTTFTLHHQALLSVEPEMQNTAVYIEVYLFRKVF